MRGARFGRAGRFTRWAVALVVASSGSTASARDLGRQNYLLGERAAGMGGAFISLTGDAASAYYNPAGLAGQLKQGISLSASAYSAHVEDYTGLIDIGMGAGAPRLTADLDSFSFATFPSSIVYVLPLGAGEGDQARPMRSVVAFSVLVPDYDKYAGKLNMPARDYLWEMKGAYAFDEQTYWVGPSGAIEVGGWLRAGASVFALVHMNSTNITQGIKAVWADNSETYLSNVEQRSSTAATALAQVGVQLQVAERITVGATIRTPTFGTLYSSGSALQFNSLLAKDGLGATTAAYVDRIEASDGLKAQYRLPLMAGIGISYSKPASFTVAADATWHARLPAYRTLDGQVVYPTDAHGTRIIDGTRALDPVTEAQGESVLNANLGAELIISPRHFARLGLFTNFSTVPRARDELGNPKVDTYGVSLGYGLKGERSTTSVGIVYVGGTGSTVGLNGAFLEPPNRASVALHTITAVLSGSADL